MAYSVRGNRERALPRELKKKVTKANKPVVEETVVETPVVVETAPEFFLEPSDSIVEEV